MAEVRSDWNYAAVLRDVARAVPERVAIVCHDQRLTYAEFAEAAQQFARGCAHLGLLPGDKIAIDLLNRPEYLVAFYGTLLFGGVPVNVNYRYRATELAYLLDYVDAAAVVVQEEFVDAIDEALASRPRDVVKVLVPSSGSEPDGSLTFAQLLRDGAAAAPVDREPIGDDLIFVCTGGTTGMPKAVMWRNDDLYVSQWHLSRPGTEPRDPVAAVSAGKRAATTLPAPPLMHGTGLYAALGTLSGGGTVVLLDRLGFEPVHVWNAIADERVEIVTVVGDVFARPLLDALDGLDGRDVSSLRVISSSGAVLSAAVKARLIERLPGLRIVDSFGSTEGMVSRVVSTDADTARARFKVSNRVLVVSDGEAVEPGSGEVGMLAVSGRLPVGYYKDAAKTAATFPSIGGRRFSVAGDLATVESDGTIVFLGRGSATINTGGEKVFPEEVESELRACAPIVDCCVVGVADPKWGQRVVAVVQPAPGAPLDVGEVTAELKHRLAGYKVPKDIVVVASLERGPNGKLDYRRIGELAAKGAT